MSWVLTAVLCIILIEIVVRLPLPATVSEIRQVSRKAVHTLGSKFISDHWKEKVLLAYAGSLLTATMKLAGFIVIVGLLAYLLIYIFDYVGADTGNFVVSWIGILYSVIVATVYLKVRMSFV